MAKKMIRPIHSEADYDTAPNEIDRHFEKEPRPGTPEADRFDLLALIIQRILISTIRVSNRQGWT